jgi:hypothetical protein
MSTAPSILISVSRKDDRWVAREATSGKDFDFSHLLDLFLFAASQWPKKTVSYMLAEECTVEDRMAFLETYKMMAGK